MPGKHHLRGFKIAQKKIGSPLRGSSLRCSASSLGQTPPLGKKLDPPLHWPRQFLSCRVSSVVRAECIALLLLSKRWLRVRNPLLLILFFFKINVHIMYIALYSVRNKVKDWSLFSRQVALTNKSPLASLSILRYKNSPPAQVLFVGLLFVVVLFSSLAACHRGRYHFARWLSVNWSLDRGTNGKNSLEKGV